MIYLLIDNCTLLQLVAIEGYNEYITKLTDNINSGQIKLLTHQNIIDEWEKHKIKHKKRKEQKLLPRSDNTKEGAGDSKSSLPSRLTMNILHLDLQTEQVDSLLSKAVKIETPEIITKEFAERFRKRLAPFHNKKDSLSDWEIIGSACIYCESHGINSLYFLSSNHTDFADELEINRTIHPTLKERFPNIIIHYFRNYSDFFNELHIVVDSIPHQLIPFRLIANEKFSFKTSVKKTDLESLYFLYKELYSEINFIPTHILSKYFPFAENENSKTYYHTFSIQNVRESLIDFFKNIEIGHNNVINFKEREGIETIKNYEELTEYVLSRLTQNLVFSVSTGHNKLASIYYVQHFTCGCARCTFSRFEFNDAFSQLKIQTANLKEKLKQAYVNSQLGNFKISALSYLEIAAQAYKEKKYLTYFIARYNLKHLASFLNNFFYNEDIDAELVSTLSKIDPLEDAVKLKTHTDYNFISFIAQEDYFNEAFQKIAEALNEIRDHYRLQLRGDWSNNQNILKLSNAFARLNSFVNDNFILFDQYSNFKELFKMVTEALFASHAIIETQGARIEEFDDYWVYKFIVYGDQKTIIKYFNQYNLKLLKYRQTGSEKDSFIELAENLFNNSSDASDFHEDENFENRYFPHLYNNLFENLLTIAALLELDELKTNRFADSLLNFLSSGKKIYSSSISSITIFLRKKGNLFTDSVLHNYFITFLHNEQFKHGELLESVVEIISKRIYIVDKESLNYLINFTIAKCEKCQERHSPDIIVSLFVGGDDEVKQKISNCVHLELEKEFYFELYYLALINDIITFDQDKFFSLIDKVDVGKEHHTFRSIFTGQKDFRNDRVNALFNICFKFQIDTSSSKFEKFKKLGKYYEWLVNFDSFNYELFEPEWILEHKTFYYFKAMSSSKKLLSAIRDYLKTNSHPGIENVLLRITNFIN